MRKDFSSNDKKILAERAGYICCFPGCGMLTIGPSNEKDNKTSNTGMACHIYPASSGKGARRINKNISDSELSSISNGIWMCYLHGKLIDTDEVRFSVNILKEWKRIGEEIARIRTENKYNYDEASKIVYSGSKLISNKISLPDESKLNDLVGNLFNDSCVGLIWGNDIINSIRDFIIEYVRNIYSHGGATSIELIIDGDKISIINNGDDFDPRGLIYNDFKIEDFKNDNFRGGTYSINYLFKKYNSNIFLGFSRENNINTFVISKPSSKDSIKNITKCYIDLNDKDLKILRTPIISINESCREIVVILPKFFLYSDVRFIDIKNDNNKKIIFIIEKEISNMIKDFLVHYYNNSQIIII